MMLDYPLVIFDLDGTLVDSAADIAEALDLTLQQQQLAAVGESTVRGWIGEGARTLLQTALRAQHSALSVEALMPQFMRHYHDCLLHRPRLYPGAAEAVRALRARGSTLAICSNKPESMIRPLLRHFSIDDCFAAVIGADSLAERKPSPLPLLHLAQRFGLAPGQCLMVGDSATDAAAAQAAVMPLALVRYGYLRGLDPAQAGAVVVLDDLRGLL